MTYDQFRLLLTVARVLRAIRSEMLDYYSKEDTEALTEALAPWAPCKQETYLEEGQQVSAPSADESIEAFLSRTKLSVRVHNCIKSIAMDAAPIYFFDEKKEIPQTVGQLRALSDHLFTRIPNFGNKSLKELRKAIGYSISPEYRIFSDDQLRDAK